jgi:chemotaxis protein methyltransferase CheR
LTEAEFDYLRALVKARSGLALSPEKRYLVENRLAALCRKRAIASLADLVLQLKTRRQADLEGAVAEAMTTNETFFFRDKVPFDLFRDVLLPRLIAARAATRSIRIWCAAASTGQEPYSLAMILRDAAARLAGWRIEVIATDLSHEVLKKARAGVYTQFEVQRGLPIQLLLRHFEQVGTDWALSPQIRAMVTFKALNLIESFSYLGRFDVIFCRNVLIYFDVATKSDVLRRLGGALAPDGALVLGAAETLLGVSDAFDPHPQHRGLYIPAAPASPLRLVASR